MGAVFRLTRFSLVRTPVRDPGPQKFQGILGLGRGGQLDPHDKEPAKSESWKRTRHRSAAKGVQQNESGKKATKNNVDNVNLLGKQPPQGIC